MLIKILGFILLLPKHFSDFQFFKNYSPCEAHEGLQGLGYIASISHCWRCATALCFLRHNLRRWHFPAHRHDVPRWQHCPCVGSDVQFSIGVQLTCKQLPLFKQIVVSYVTTPNYCCPNNNLISVSQQIKRKWMSTYINLYNLIMVLRQNKLMFFPPFKLHCEQLKWDTANNHFLCILQLYHIT